MFLESKDYLAYKVGPLLYCPANKLGMATKIINNEIEGLSSICFCLEDSIKDEAVEQAEDILVRTLEEIKTAKVNKEELPLIFVRPRTPKHLAKVYKKIEEYASVLTGFVLPKFDLDNADEYMSIIDSKNAEYSQLFVMPTLESSMVASVLGRAERLCKIKEILDRYKSFILNVRVGGNDFANVFGLRRSVKQNIYQMGVIQNILVDVLNVFSQDYVVSGPVWEYFGDNKEDAWAVGLRKEIELDMLNGFIGKTVIHPSQIPVVLDALKVSVKDYEDAKDIIDWKSSVSGVAKSSLNGRMNEVKTHTKWAKKICMLGDIYGVKGDN